MWGKVLVPTMMSSEESGNEENEDILLVHPLVWRSGKVNQFFSLLDEKAMEGKSPQARRQMKKRVKGDVSARDPPGPFSSSLPKWALN